MNDQGFTQEEYEKQRKLKKKPKPELTEEEKEELARLKKQKKERGKAVSILRGISVRMPLLIYGADVPFEEDINIDRFVDIVDDESWKEFMPDKVTKDLFQKFTKYYDRDVFIAAGKEIRRLSKKADAMLPTQRVQSVTKLFSYFKNPDKETVLTPWRVVNIHMGECLGGYDFFNEAHDETIEDPRFVDQGEVTQKTLANPNAKILEINSKTGLYPLYVAYSIYRAKCKEHQKELTEELHQKLWNETVQNNVFVICKTEMAKYITRRTLLGYKPGKMNAHYFDDLINQFKNKSDQVVKKILNRNYWGVEGRENMKFDAIVGNPPYQETMEKTSDNPVYHIFIDGAISMCNLITLITPARFLFNAGKTPKVWNKKMLNDEHFRVIKYWADSTEIFPNVDIKGGIAITEYDKSNKFPKIGVFTNHPQLTSILHKVWRRNPDSFDSLIFAPESYRLSTRIHKDYPDLINRLSSGHMYDITSNIFEKLGNGILFDEAPHDGLQYIQLFGRENNARGYKWVRRDYINPHQNLDAFKVFLPKSNGSGALGEVLSSPLVAKPGVGHTQTFISIGSFKTEFEAIAALKYVKTRFLRTMLGVLKVTQDNKKSVWHFIPNQDFSPSSDIDWNKTIPEIDTQLYHKYELSQFEIDFIEKNIIPMK